MQNWTADILLEAGLELGEGATWHPVWKRFLYVDIENKKVARIDPLTRISEEVQLHHRVSVVVPTSSNKLLVALQGSLALLDFDQATTTKLVQLEPDKTGNRCNDGKCDVKGGVWIGTMQIRAKHNEGAV